MTKASDATAYLLVEAAKHGGPSQDQATIAAAERFAREEHASVMAWQHPLSQNYDEGQRDALRDLVKAAAALAERQVKRSAQTASSPHAEPADTKEHAYDVAILEAIQAVLAYPR